MRPDLYAAIVILSGSEGSTARPSAASLAFRPSTFTVKSFKISAKPLEMRPLAASSDANMRYEGLEEPKTDSASRASASKPKALPSDTWR